MSHRRPYSVRGSFAVALVILAGSAERSPAALVVTAAGAAEGFSVSTFASNFPSVGGVGPLGIGFPTTGGVLVSDYGGNIRFFPTDTNNQNAAAFAPVVTLGPSGGGNAFDIARLNGVLYMTQRDLGQVVQLNNNGTVNQVIVSGLTTPHGIVATPDGHLLVATYFGGVVYEIDPIAKTTALKFFASLDGITINQAGTVLYGARVSGGDAIIGYSLVAGSVGNIVFDSLFVPGDPDGSALGFGPLAGKIFANNNDGTIIEIDLTTKAQVVIATGGSRGDFVTVDPNDGSLLLTQTDSIVRLSNGGAFLPTKNTPEPSSRLAMGVVALAALAWYRRRVFANRFASPVAS